LRAAPETLLSGLAAFSAVGTSRRNEIRVVKRLQGGFVVTSQQTGKFFHKLLILNDCMEKPL